MNWHITLIGLGATLGAAVISFAVVRAVPNYDDAEEVQRSLIGGRTTP